MSCCAWTYKRKSKHLEPEPVHTELERKHRNTSGRQKEEDEEEDERVGRSRHWPPQSVTVNLMAALLPLPALQNTSFV